MVHFKSKKGLTTEDKKELDFLRKNIVHYRNLEKKIAQEQPHNKLNISDSSSSVLIYLYLER